MNGTIFISALIIALSILAQPWSHYLLGYTSIETDAAKAVCEDLGTRDLAKGVGVSERVSTLILATCK